MKQCSAHFRIISPSEEAVPGVSQIASRVNERFLYLPPHPAPEASRSLGRETEPGGDGESPAKDWRRIALYYKSGLARILMRFEVPFSCSVLE